MSYNLVEHLETMKDETSFDRFKNLEIKERKALYYKNKKFLKERILHLAEQYHGFTEYEVFGKSRGHDHCYMRFFFYKLFVFQMNISKREAAHFFNRTNAVVHRAFGEYPLPNNTVFKDVEDKFKDYINILFDGII